ncbi:MAG TPA: hypothetical protein VE078_06465 [Thermoanaerobaculia bacterium]|nr:hypothetical protein [Thermoanaerobaculia bacterium]
MKRSASLGLGTALFLLLTASASAQPTPPTPTAGEQEPAAVDQRQLQESAGQVRQDVEKLLRQLQATASVAQIETVLENQRRLETLAVTALGLLALTALLASTGLVLALQQRKAVLALAKEKEAEKELAGAGGESPGTPAADTGSGESAASDLRTSSETGAATTGGDPVLAAQDTGHLATAPEAELVSHAADDEELPWLPPGMRHRDIALLLARLRREAPRLAERFADGELRKRFRGELDAPVHARLNRLIALSEKGDELLRERWLGPDLVTTLDALACFYSEAVAEERNGHDTGLARDLRGWLYDSFGPVCRSEGWFAIDTVDPYKTRFDPQVHHAVAGRDVDGAEGQVIAVKAIGRRDATTGAVKHRAEVIVGR